MENAQPQYDEEDARWEYLLTLRDANIAICKPGMALGYLTCQAPLSFENVGALLGSPHIYRVPLRDACGTHVHIYVVGSWSNDHDTVAARSALPVNEEASHFLHRWGVEMEVRGTMIVISGGAIHERDLQHDLIAQDAATIPEVERDHHLFVGPSAHDAWGVIEQAMEGGMIPDMFDRVPSAARIAWLVRTAITGLELDVETHASVLEACSKHPMLAQALGALWNFQAHYFSQNFTDFDQSELETPFRPVSKPLPAGWNKQYGRVVH